MTEERKKQKRKYYQSHRDNILSYNRKYYREHREELLEKQKFYRIKYKAMKES